MKSQCLNVYKFQVNSSHCNIWDKWEYEIFQSGPKRCTDQPAEWLQPKGRKMEKEEWHRHQKQSLSMQRFSVLNSEPEVNTGDQLVDKSMSQLTEKQWTTILVWQNTSPLTNLSWTFNCENVLSYSMNKNFDDTLNYHLLSMKAKHCKHISESSFSNICLF